MLAIAAAEAVLVAAESLLACASFAFAALASALAFLSLLFALTRRLLALRFAAFEPTLRTTLAILRADLFALVAFVNDPAAASAAS